MLPTEFILSLVSILHQGGVSSGNLPRMTILGFRTASLGLLTLLFSFLAQGEGTGIKVALITDSAGKNDKSFNESAYRGLLRVEKELGAEIKVVEAPDNNAYETLLRSLSEKKYDLIISIGFLQRDAIRKVAPRFPNQKYALIDADAGLPNVKSVLFEEQEGSYLVGALAALHSKTGVVGFIGGMDVPLIRRFQMGYEAGAKQANPKVQVLSNYLGVTPEAWNNPPKAKELALDQIQRKADVIFVAAGNSGIGVFDAVEAKKVFAIGVDSNQNWIRPGRILTSMVKSVDNAVFEMAQALKAGTFQGGTSRFGLKNNGVSFAVDSFNKSLLSKEALKQTETFKAEIISGKRQVPDYYLKNGKS